MTNLSDVELVELLRKIEPKTNFEKRFILGMSDGLKRKGIVNFEMNERQRHIAEQIIFNLWNSLWKRAGSRKIKTARSKKKTIREKLEFQQLDKELEF